VGNEHEVATKKTSTKTKRHKTSTLYGPGWVGRKKEERKKEKKGSLRKKKILNGKKREMQSPDNTESRKRGRRVGR